MNAFQRWRQLAGASLVLAVLSATAGVAFAAGVPESIAKLKGKSDDKAGEAFARAGYQLQGEKQQWDRKDSFWWNQKDRQCLRLTSRFGFVSGVSTVSEADCTNALPAGGVVPGRPGTLVAADLLGLSRKGGEAKLAAAGFNATWTHESEGSGIQMLWYNQHTRQCIAATVIGGNFDLAQDVPENKCR